MVFFIKFFQVVLFENVGLSPSLCCQASSFLGLSCSLWQGLRYKLNPLILETRTTIFYSTLLMGISLLFFPYLLTLEQVIIATLFLSLSYSIIIPTTLSYICKTEYFSKELSTSYCQSVQAMAKVLAPCISEQLLL